MNWPLLKVGGLLCGVGKKITVKAFSIQTRPLFIIPKVPSFRKSCQIMLFLWFDISGLHMG